jgi:hypothetical protein
MKLFSVPWNQISSDKNTNPQTSVDDSEKNAYKNSLRVILVAPFNLQAISKYNPT